MNRLEEYAIGTLKDFTEKATRDGICYNGSDMNRELQVLIIELVEDYVKEYEGKDNG